MAADPVRMVDFFLPDSLGEAERALQQATLPSCNLLLAGPAHWCALGVVVCVSP
jgi:hypothetical protein